MVSEFETRKDTIQELTESAADHVGRIAQIITAAVRDVAREIGDWATDVIEMNEASRRARADERRAPSADREAPGPVVVDESP
ncbi:MULTISPECIES: hypothetical protein [Actinokineospora]|uniref:Uncharacterized protein n=1 Tax=Actinokineospora fastidiosa TaxID=1816 RepID=A0A918GJV7_9PSEU|nr:MULTISPECIES: hypothetical protein [Actinokineospora]UVS77787.1 hypothetical protein Actkin_01508 [Actinokineospora sp. UTMC 2448]GGS41003.1 hypothetical protein GCM10010171_39490 [Actinokineospora fastidiosa]